MHVFVRPMVAVVVLALMLLNGCGSSTAPVTAPVTPTPIVANPASALSGNWILTASAPTALFGVASNDKVRLALTVDVTGDNVAAAGYGNHFCGATTSSGITGAILSAGIATALTGTVAQDGTFSLQSQTGGSLASTIKGKAPSGLGSPWSGTYALTFTDFASGFLQGCNETVTDSFTAAYLPLVSGTYTGIATPSAPTSGLPVIIFTPPGTTSATAGTTSTLPGTTSATAANTPMTLQITLQQGGTATDVMTGKTLTGNSVLNGSIKVQGSPCFTTGTTQGGMSNVIGNRIQASFVMDDGSTLLVIGTLDDAAESRIVVSIVRMGEPCASASGYPLYMMDVLNKQP